MESYNKQIIPRLDYTQKLEAWANSPDLVKIITGVRRCGKSTLFKLFQERLIKNRGVLPDQIIDINLEILPQTESIGLKYNKKNFLTNYSVLHDYILETINKKKMLTICLNRMNFSLRIIYIIQKMDTLDSLIIQLLAKNSMNQGSPLVLWQFISFILITV